MICSRLFFIFVDSINCSRTKFEAIIDCKSLGLFTKRLLDHFAFSSDFCALVFFSAA